MNGARRKIGAPEACTQVPRRGIRAGSLKKQGYEGPHWSLCGERWEQGFVRGDAWERAEE